VQESRESADHTLLACSPKYITDFVVCILWYKIKGLIQLFDIQVKMDEIIYNTIQYNFIDLRRRNSLLVRLQDRDAGFDLT